MTEALKQTLVAKTHDLMNAPSCCAEAKAAAQRWLDALGTSSEAEETRAYIAELEGDIMPVDMLAAFMGSDTAVKLFDAKELQAKGAAYCDCPACTACEAILAHKSELV